MQASDVMTTGAATIRPDAALVDAVRLMVEHGISGLPVVDAQGALTGVITESDFLREFPGRSSALLAAVETGAEIKRELQTRKVEELMSRNPISVGLATPLQEVVDLMTKHGVRRVPVVADGRVVGIVSRANLLLSLLRKAEAPARPPSA